MALRIATRIRADRKMFGMARDGQPVWTALRLKPRDNVATALRDLPVETVPKIPDCAAPTLRNAVARGHKFALTEIAAGEHAVKYGQAIGVALADIAPGEHVHLHNIEGIAGRAERHRNSS